MLVLLNKFILSKEKKILQITFNINTNYNEENNHTE